MKKVGLIIISTERNVFWVVFLIVNLSIYSLFTTRYKITSLVQIVTALSYCRCNPYL